GGQDKISQSLCRLDGLPGFLTFFLHENDVDAHAIFSYWKEPFAVVTTSGLACGPIHKRGRLWLRGLPSSNPVPPSNLVPKLLFGNARSRNSVSRGETEFPGVRSQTGSLGTRGEERGGDEEWKAATASTFKNEICCSFPKKPKDSLIFLL